MAELKPDSALDTLMRLVINLAGFGLSVALIALVVATVIAETD